MAKVNNQISFKELVSLTKWLEPRADSIRMRRPSYRIVAQEASQKLGRKFTESNIRAAADACGMTWPAKRTIVNRTGYKHSTAILAGAIVKIAEALDMEVDQNVHQIANKLRLLNSYEK